MAMHKTDWLAAYQRSIARKLSGCAKPSKSSPLPAGHMYYDRGLSPSVAAKRYIESTKYGKQKCYLKKRGK